ncbi:zinc metalloprotease [Pilimelia anulata]|uniref:Zinc metalloprotease n=1 Tax=Pilimelia anulata TaxID=53371 RepID=A0A8J3FBR8_9ACTN|nr:zinc metalloprotease [Pilimelia anulata]GGJ86475.1 zinc metalloprotease [Pilimelia anulata]
MISITPWCRRALAVTSIGALALVGPLPVAAGTAASAAPCDDAAATAARGQHPRHDGNEYTAAQKARYEADFQRRLREQPQDLTPGAPVTIPVYVHVVAKDSSREGGNIPDSMINDQMKVLADSFAGSTGGSASEFRFAVQKINRVIKPEWVPIKISEGGAEGAMKKQLRQGGAGTLNLYLGPLDPNLLGWATLPADGAGTYDGVVVAAESLPGGTIGSYNLGDTGTHEVGHWLGLYHTFNEDNTCDEPGDHVDDTPAEKSPASGCPKDRDTCTAPGKDPVDNFMDYSDDACMNKFTAGQVQRMDDQWRTYREGK